MKEKILAFLKTKIGTHAGGIQDNYLLGIANAYSKTITEESQIATVLTDGVLESIKSTYDFIVPEIDRKAEAKTKAELKAFQEKHGLDENGKLIEDPLKKKVKDVIPDPNEPAWFTAFKKEQGESTAALKAEIEAQKQEKTLTALSEKVKMHEKLKDIPQSYLKGRNLVPKSEADIDQLVTSIETDYNGFKQEMAEKGVTISIPSAGGGPTSEKENITEYLDEKFPKVPQGDVLINK